MKIVTTTHAKQISKPLYVAIVLSSILIISVLTPIALNNNFTFDACLIAITGILFLYLVAIANKTTLKFIITYFVLQNFVLIVLSNKLGNTYTSYLLIYKELIVYAIILIYILKKNFVIVKYNKILLLYVIYLIANLIVSKQNTMATLTSFRQLMIAPTLFLFGISLNINSISLKKSLKYLIFISIIVAFFGFIERFFISGQTWTNIGYYNYLINKGFEKWASYGTDPFVTYDLFKYTGQGVRRMASFFADGIALGHFIIIPMFYIIFGNLLKNKMLKCILSILFFIVLILSISKGAYLVFGLSLLFYNMFKNEGKIKKILILFIILISGAFFITNYKSLGNSATHISGLISAFQNLKPLGYGIGSSGNLANLFSDSSTGDGAENYIGSLMSQTGLIGLILFVMFYVNMIKKVLDNNINKNKFTYIIISYSSALLIEAFVSESSITFIGSGLCFIFMGILSKIQGNGKQLDA